MTAASYALPGLSAHGEILVDRWGIPHIYAASQPDAFLLQGFNAARDRLWQIDLWRRRGLGRLSAAFGRRYLEQDRAARLFLYRGDIARECAAYGDGRAGDRDRVRRRRQRVHRSDRARQRAPLPVEFEAMGYAPERWAPEDIVRIRSHGLVSNLSDQVARALVLRDFGRKAEALRQRLEPSWRLRGARRARPRRDPRRRARRVRARDRARRVRRRGRGRAPLRAAARARTTGRSPGGAPRAGGRSSPTTRIARRACRRCATSRTSSRPGST